MQAAARRQVAWLFGLALGLRLLVVAFAHDRFPPADDGSFYHAVAIRIAEGAGYTWVWPDGVVTHAAHYPVGYPALLGVFYALFGATPLNAMLVNALLAARSWSWVFTRARSASARCGVQGLRRWQSRYTRL